MTVTTLLKGAITGASALALAGAVLAQVSTGTPSTGSGVGMTPPPSTGVTTDTSRLTTDCSQAAANARANQPPHDPMACNRAAAAAAVVAPSASPSPPTAAATSSAGPTSSSTTTAATNAEPAAAGPTTQQATTPPTRLARADRG